MPELDLKDGGDSGYPFESPHLDVEIYRLITTVAASQVFAKELEDGQDAPMWKWYKRMEMPEISRLLVSISAVARNNIDSRWNAGDSYPAQVEKPVGVLIPNRDYPDRAEGLGFRNACNKILHADQVNPEVVDLEKGLVSALEPQVHLYGEYRGSEWKATIDIYDFAMAAGAVC